MLIKDIMIKETSSAGSTSSGAIATNVATGDGAGWGLSPFMKDYKKAETKAKKKPKSEQIIKRAMK